MRGYLIKSLCLVYERKRKKSRGGERKVVEIVVFGVCVFFFSTVGIEKKCESLEGFL